MFISQSTTRTAIGARLHPPRGYLRHPPGPLVAIFRCPKIADPMDYDMPRRFKGAPCLRRKIVFRKKAPGKKKYVRGKRDHKLTGPGRTVWVVRTGRRAYEEVEQVCSDRYETCTSYLQLLCEFVLLYRRIKRVGLNLSL